MASFMKPQIRHGVFTLADDGVDSGGYKMWGSRLIAQGYMDRTDWGIYPSKEAAIEGLREMYCACSIDSNCDVCLDLEAFE